MRTKTLLLTVGLAAAGLAAQAATDVTSVNAVGYVNKQIRLNWNMIGAPFESSNNDPSYLRLDNLFPADQMKNSLAAYLIPDAAHNITSQVAFFLPSDGFWDFGGNPEWSLTSGNGVLMYSSPTGENPANFTFTTVGQVRQSVVNAGVTNPIPRFTIPSGYSIQSSVVPQEGGIQTVLGFNPTANCNVTLFDANFNNTRLTPPYFYSTDDGFWDGPVGYPAGSNGDPVLGYAEACLMFSVAEQAWTRTFTVN